MPRREPVDVAAHEVHLVEIRDGIQGQQGGKRRGGILQDSTSPLVLYGVETPTTIWLTKTRTQAIRIYF